MQTLTRARMDASKKRRVAFYPIDATTRVRLQSLTESEKSYFDSYVADTDGKWSRERAAMRRRLLIQMSMIGDDGKQCYSENELDEMLNCDALLTEKVYELAVKHTGVFAETGNALTGSATTGDSDSSTDSASSSASTTPKPGSTPSLPTSSTDGLTTTNASPGVMTGDSLE